MKPWRWTKDDLIAAYAKRHPVQATPTYQKVVVWAFVLMGVGWVVYRVYLWVSR